MRGDPGDGHMFTCAYQLVQTAVIIMMRGRVGRVRWPPSERNFTRLNGHPVCFARGRRWPPLSMC